VSAAHRGRPRLGARWALGVLVAPALLVAGPTPARAGAPVAWQAIVGASGFQLQVPSGWSVRPPAGATSLQEAIVSPDGQAHVNIYVTEQTIATSDLPLFLTTYVGNAAIGAPSLGQPQPATVPGAAAAATLTATYTDRSGTRVSETALAAATGAQLYVLEIVTPALDAQQNADEIQAIVQSFAIAAS
jgi:hypothetical protein